MAMDVKIGSEPESDDLFAELRDNDQPWGEIRWDATTRRFMLVLYPPETGDPHVFTLGEAEEALATAKDALIRRGYVES